MTLVSPDLSPANVDQLATVLTEQLGPFIPKKARAVVYATAGLIAVVAPSIGLVVGGTVEIILIGVGAAAAAIAGTMALSHLNA